MKEIVTEDNLSDVLSSNSSVVVLYGAGWCGNCRLVKPKFKKLAEETAGTEFVYVDAEKSPNSRKFAEIVNLPTFAAFKNGSLVAQKEGNKIEFVKELLDALASH
jgi:thioredoxin-like negative regulator of GroEL